MKNKILLAAGITFFAGSFLLAGNSVATDDYDVKAFGPKRPIVWNNPTEVIFEHRTHTDKHKVKCSSCHGELFAMQRGVAEKSGKFTMASLDDGLFCGGCHNGKAAFSTTTNCQACHILPADPIVMIKPVKAVAFFHEIHDKDVDLKCSSCHDDVFAMRAGNAERSSKFIMQSLYDGKYCGTCHNGERAFASNTRCNTCHIGTTGYDRLMGIDPHAKPSTDTSGGH